MRWLPLRLLLLAPLGATFILAASAEADIYAYGYKAKGSINVGQVVALVQNDSSTVELAPANDPSRIYGVAVSLNDAPLAVQIPGQTVMVATSGIYKVSVTNQNGSIKSGDYLSMSANDGVAAKARGQEYIVGRATESFNSTTGSVSANLTPGKNPNISQDAAVPALLRSLTESIAGKTLAANRIYAALIIFLVTGVIALSLLWASAKSGIISIGRNPLSKSSVLQGLAQVFVASLVVFIGGLVGVYLFLRI